MLLDPYQPCSVHKPLRLIEMHHAKYDLRRKSGVFPGSQFSTTVALSAETPPRQEHSLQRGKRDADALQTQRLTPKVREL